MLRKYLVIAFILLLSGEKALAQTTSDKKELAFVATATAVVDNFYKKNTKKLDSYIDPKNGTYITYRPGAADTYKNIAKFDINDLVIFENTTVIKPNYTKTPLLFGKLPAYNCDKGQWNRIGFAADSVKNYKPVSTIVAFRIKYNEEKISKKEADKIKAIENNSRKVVYAGTKAKGIVFYLAWRAGTWYLAVVDVVTTDCSI